MKEAGLEPAKPLRTQGPKPCGFDRFPTLSKLFVTTKTLMKKLLIKDIKLCLINLHGESRTRTCETAWMGDFKSPGFDYSPISPYAQKRTRTFETPTDMGCLIYSIFSKNHFESHAFATSLSVPRLFTDQKLVKVDIKSDYKIQKSYQLFTNF